MIDSPKKTCNLKTFFLTNFSGVLHDLLPFNSIWSKFSLTSSKSKKRWRMTLKFSTRETERLQTKTLLKIFLLFIFLIVINPVRIKNLFFSGVTDENIKNGTVLTKFQIILINNRSINKTYITWSYLYMYKNLYQKFTLATSTRIVSACFTLFHFINWQTLINYRSFFTYAGLIFQKIIY